MNLSDAIRMNIVKVQGTGNGGYTGQALQLKITNNSGNPLLLTVDPAVIFRPADTAQQDLVLAGNEKISVQPFKEAGAVVQTFCAKSYARAPVKGEAFSFLKKGSDTLEKVLVFLRQNNLLYSPLAQSAVWVVTNDHDLEGVYQPTMVKQSEKLVAYLSGITGKAVPKVFRVHEHRTEPGKPVFNPKAFTIVANFEQTLNAPEVLSLGVYNEAGAMIQPVFENRQFGKGGHRFKVDFEARNVAAGTYYIRLSSGEQILQQQDIRVD